MSVNGIGSYSFAAEWRSVQYRSQQDAGPSGTSCSCGDSAMISTQGFAALLSDQSAQPVSQAPGLTDDRAAKIGAKIQATNPDLFKQLDTNGDGTLSADEVEAGKDQIQAARAAAIGTKLQQSDPALFKALDSNGDGTLSAQELQAGRQALGGGGGSVHHHHHHHHHGAAGAGGGGATAADAMSTAPAADADQQAGSDQQTAQERFLYNSLNDLLQRLSTGAST